MDDPRDYEVGYGKTPVHSRFKPGQSGNPKGRRTRKTEPASLLAEILKELNAVVTINENGEKMRVTKQQLLDSAAVDVNDVYYYVHNTMPGRTPSEGAVKQQPEPVAVETAEPSLSSVIRASEGAFELTSNTTGMLAVSASPPWTLIEPLAAVNDITAGPASESTDEYTWPCRMASRTVRPSAAASPVNRTSGKAIENDRKTSSYAGICSAAVPR